MDQEAIVVVGVGPNPKIVSAPPLAAFTNSTLTLPLLNIKRVAETYPLLVQAGRLVSGRDHHWPLILRGGDA